MYAKILILLVLVILCTGCTDPDIPDPCEFEDITPGAPALTKVWDEETQTISIMSPVDVTWLTIENISAVPDLCIFTEILNVTAHVNYNLNAAKDFKFGWVQHSGKNGVADVDVSKLINESYEVVIDEYGIVQVNTSVYNNETGLNETVTTNQTVTTGNHTETRYRDVWQAWTPAGNMMSAGESVLVKIVYHKKAELGDVRIQTIPMFAGIKCEELTWWNTSWNYRRNITINHSMVDAAMTNFPVMVSITQTGLNTDGNDTRITDSSDNQVAREIECYNSTSGELTFFFNGTSISNTVNTSFWMYYNNSAATEPAADSTYGSQAVWDSNYVFVSHMVDVTSTTIKDSTGTVSDGTKAGTATAMNDADYGKCQYFAKTGYISFPSTNFFGSNNDFTITVKVNPASSQPAYAAIFDWGHYPSYSGLAIEQSSTSLNQYRTFWSSDGSTFTSSPISQLIADDWNTFTTVKSGTSQTNYLNTAGGSPNAVGADFVTAAHVLDFGRYTAGNSRYWGGYNAEVRFDNSGRSSNYITTTHKNLNNPTAAGTAPFFASFGAEESVSIITAYTPSTPLQKTTGDSQLFTVNTSENSQCRWYINGSLMQTNSTGATRHEYTNTSLDEGYWNFTATANTTDRTSSQTWWVTVAAPGTFGQDMYKDRWMYVTYLNGSNTNLSEFFTDLSPYYLSFYNATDQKTYNYKSGRWEKYADKIIKPGEAAMLRYTANITKTRDNADSTFGFTMKTGLNHIGHSYNGTRNLTWYNTTIASANLVTITHQNPETGTLSTFTYGSADNGSVNVLQGCGVEVNVSADTVVSGL